MMCKTVYRSVTRRAKWVIFFGGGDFTSPQGRYSDILSVIDRAMEEKKESKKK